MKIEVLPDSDSVAREAAKFADRAPASGLGSN